MSKPTESQAPIFVAYYELLGWILDRVEKFPKSQQFIFGQRIANRAVDTLEMIVQALYARDKLDLLRRAGLSVEVLRILLRLTFDRRLISRDQYEFAAQKLAEVGAMLGGWIKQQDKR